MHATSAMLGMGPHYMPFFTSSATNALFGSYNEFEGVDLSIFEMKVCGKLGCLH